MTLRTTTLLLVAGTLALAGCKSTIKEMDESMKTGLSDLEQDMQGVSDFFDDRVGPYDEYVFGVNWAADKADRGLYKPDHRFYDYLQKVGTTVALATHYPYTYEGYTFAVQDVEKPHAVAVPSGFIFISRGLLQTVRNEDQLAAVLAHELAHHELRHNMLEVAAGKAYEVANALFEDDSQSGRTILDMMSIGYTRRHELEADRRAVELLALAGYDPRALVKVLDQLKNAGGSLGGRGYPDDRAKLARQHIEDLNLPEREIPEVRTRRFQQAVAGFADVNVARAGAAT